MNHRLQHRVKKMCKVLGVNESGYYRWQKRTPGRKELDDQAIVEAIRGIEEKYHQTYGAKKLQHELEKVGKSVSIGKIYRLMRQNGIYTVHRCKHRPYPKEDLESRYSENLLSQNFSAGGPDKVWAGDITYIRSEAGWVYLAVVLDLFNKEVVGYSVSNRVNAELAKQAMEEAMLNRGYPEGVVFHSDRGCQYSSLKYQDYLDENKVTGSMSRKGNPYDNACCESFFASLKKEWIYHRKYKNLSHVESSLFEYIELFYNRRRMHESLGYLSPREYLKQHLQSKTA